MFAPFMMRCKTLVWVFCFSVVFFFSANLVAATETTASFKFTKVDLELLEKANQTDRELERKALVYDDPEATAYLERIGNKLVPEGRLENVTWRFRVLRDPMPNAFALPNGSIYIQSGLLVLLHNEAQLAAVLGHEITHVTNRHSYLENRSNRKKIATINILLAAGGTVGSFGGAAGGAVNAVLGGLVPNIIVVTIYGYSRELEHEADEYGLRAMARNNYPPREMAAFFEQLKYGYEVPLEKEPGLYADHPRLDDRIKYVNEVADTLPLSGKPIANAAYFSQELEPVLRHDISLEILAGRARTALGAARRLKEIDPDNFENAFWLGEAYRALGGRTPEPRSEELTDSAKSATRKQLSKMTLREYDAWLRSTPEGQSAWAANVKSAETAYNRALTLNPQNARAICGLAKLYDEDGRHTEAMKGYQQYLQLTPTAMDAYQIKRRIEELEKTSAASAASNTNHN